MNNEFTPSEPAMPPENCTDLERMQYWLTRTPGERLEEVERLRRLVHGDDYATRLRLNRSELRIQTRNMLECES